MSPFPINRVNESMVDGTKEAQGLNFNVNLIPMLQRPLLFLKDILDNSNDRTALKNIWLKSKANLNNELEVPHTVSQQELDQLRIKGFIDGEGRIIKITERGKKLISESILTDETSSFTKTASKKMIAKNSYDFGTEVLIRINDAEKFGTKYVSIPKQALENQDIRPRKIKAYKIVTKCEDGSFKKLSDYTEPELIQILHLAKKIIDEHKDIKIDANGLKMAKIPVHRIKSFAEIILKELNSR